MDKLIQKLFSKTLREVADKVDSGECEISNSNASKYIDLISEEPMSKEMASEYLRISRATFDNLVHNGEIPKGSKRVGFKELVWHKSDLDNYVLKNRKSF